MKRLFVVCLVFLILLPLSAQSKKLAILNFEDQSGNIEENTLAEMPDYIRMYFEGQSTYEIIAKEKHNSLDPSLQNCKGKPCYVKAGEALNANLIAYFKITSAGGNNYTVHVQIIDVAKKNMLISFDEKWGGDIDSFDPLSQKIVRKIVEKQKNMDALSSDLVLDMQNQEEKENRERQQAKDVELCTKAQASQEERDWEKYIRELPEGQCAAEAKAFLSKANQKKDAAACETARKTANERGWNQYLRKFPEGQCAEEAKKFANASEQKKDLEACTTARKTANEKGWKQYLKKFPEGQCAEEAKKFTNAAEQKKDLEACIEARNKVMNASGREKRKAVKFWKQYLKRFPGGQCAEEAKEFIDNN